MEDLRLLNPLSKTNDIKQLSGYPKLKPAYILKVSIGLAPAPGFLCIC